MAKLVFLFVHNGVPLVLAVIAWRWRPRSWVGLMAGAAFFAAVAVFLFLWGQWPLAGSHYARLLTMVLLAVTAWSAWRGIRDGLRPWHGGMLPTAGSVLLAVLAGYALYGAAGLVAGRDYPGPFVDLEFPLRDGRYYVSAGGSRPIINNHIRVPASAQDYAIDINKLGPLGGASRNILAPDNELHHIFGEPVYAPCGGTIVEAANHVNDNAGSTMDVDPAEGLGNYVIIDCNKTFIWLAHLRSGSVRVSEDNVVAAGDQIGQTGNSGFSQEPHLHIQAARFDENRKLYPVAMRFDGRAPVRNDVIPN